MTKKTDTDNTNRRAADTGKSVHLSASAGSGKTRALKDRYLALLDALDNSGLAIDQAVAITFTDKAAAEIKERVLRDLPEAMLKKIIRGSQDLRISTIHSFCMNLLKRYPLEAGLPPDFGVLDARDQASKIQQAIEDALEESDRDRVLMDPLRDFTTDDLMATIEFLLSIRSRLKRMEIDAGGPEGMLRSVRRGMEVDRTEQVIQSLTTSVQWRSLLQQMERILRTQGDRYDSSKGEEHALLVAAKDPDAACMIANSLSPVYFTAAGEPRKNPSIAKKAFAGKERTEYEKAFFALQALLERYRALYAHARAGREAMSLLRLFQRAEEHYQAAKLREGLLDFDDLEIYAYGLLQTGESADILYWLDRKILHFLVDEFQDTSDIQWAILNKLTEELFAGQGVDRRMPSTLFVVGDEKQSIYRFREANYRLMEDVRQKMMRNLPHESREILTLDRNFRSTPEIIETVNGVFTAIWGKAYQPSEIERREQRGSVRLIELLPDTGGTSSDYTEADVLACAITSLVGTGTTVYEKSGGGSASDGGWNARPAAFGDCAVLIQSRTRLKEYEASLQAQNIPYRVVGGIGFYEEDEIRAIMNVLFFLWNHDDKLSLAAALKSDLFGLTDRDIFDLLRADGAVIDGVNHQRPDIGKLLHGWMSFAGLVPLSRLMQRIVNESGAYIRFGRNNPQAIFNIDKLLDTGREFDRRGYTTLQDFVEWVKSIRQTEQREATAGMNLPGFQGSVSIMTVHKAKGLEYPVVFLPGMNQQSKSLSAGPPAILEDTGGGVRMAVKDAESPIYDELWGRERDELLREHQRLLYVAMTRARDHLVMIGTLNAGSTPVKQNTWLSYLHDARPGPLLDRAVPSESGLTLYACPPGVSFPVLDKTPRGGRQDRHAAPEADEINLRKVIDNLAPLPRSEAPEWKKATDYIPPEEPIGAPAPQAVARTVSPITRGSVLHRCLEEFTKSGSYDIAGIAAEYPDVLALPAGECQLFLDDAGSVLDRVLKNGSLAWVFERKPGAHSELPFLYRRGYSLVSGIIDRVVIRDGKGQVVDYKAIQIDNDQALASWVNHYRPQIQIYCEAVKEIFGLTSVTGYLLFLDSSTLTPCAET
ncbi:MAG TPA: UvrD-helicase domain-containing protein [Nitrospirota bacterium]|nr:UvrD-helicase domain-containing protein [Nitrospirota bacterium]